LRHTDGLVGGACSKDGEVRKAGQYRALDFRLGSLNFFLITRENFFETESHYVLLGGLELIILLS
jgi:hypothetical protein